jgi:hypothetical protein
MVVNTVEQLRTNLETASELLKRALGDECGCLSKQSSGVVNDIRTFLRMS